MSREVLTKVYDRRTPEREGLEASDECLSCSKDRYSPSESAVRPDYDSPSKESSLLGI